MLEMNGILRDTIENNESIWGMPSSGMLRRVTLVRIDFSEESSTSIMRVTRIG
jgi:hypothetical protein